MSDRRARQLAMHQALDEQSLAMARAMRRGMAVEDWKRLTDPARLGYFWETLGFDLWLEAVGETARELKAASITIRTERPA